jgi:two-component system, NarL family, sensor histidine kinase EvgS
MKYFSQILPLFAVLSFFLTPIVLANNSNTLSDQDTFRQNNSLQSTYTLEEQEYIKDHPVIRVGGETDWPPFDFTTVAGDYTGIANDYLQLVSKYSGLKFEVITGYSWAELLQMAKQKKLDMLPSLYHTKERTQYLNFTKPYYEITQFVFILNDNGLIKESNDLADKKVAVVKGYANNDLLRERFPSVELITKDSVMDALSAVITKEADAYVDSFAVTSYLLKQRHLDQIVPKTLANFPTAKLYMAVTKDNVLLRDIIQKALDQISAKEKARIEKKWFSAESDIPLVLSNEEKSWLNEHRVIKVGVDQNWPPFDFFEDDKHLGIASDYLAIIADRLNITFELTADKWKNVFNAAKAKELDILACAADTPERRNYFNFTDPYISIDTVLVVSKQNIGTIKNLADLTNKTVALPKGNFVQELLKSKNPGIKFHFSSSNEEALEAVALAKADAYVGNMAVADYFINKKLLTNLVIVNLTNITDSKLGIAVRKDWPIFERILQRVLAVIPAEKHLAIRKKWLHNLQKSGLVECLEVPLTAREQEFKRQHPVITYTDTDWRPIHIIEGQHNSGIDVDILNLISRKTGLKFKATLVEDWPTALKHLEEKKIDLISAVGKTPARERYGIFSEPYFTFPYALITRDNFSYINSLDDLENNTIAVGRDYTAHKLLRAKHPELTNLLLVQNVSEGFMAVANGDADILLAMMPVAIHTMQELSYQQLKVSGVADFNMPLRMMSRNDYPELISIINKGLDAIGEDEKKAVYNKWVNIKIEDKIDYSLVWKTAAAFFVILVLFFFWNRKLSQEITRRAKAERAMEQIKKEAEAANHAKSDFLAHMSHDIRTPMNGIIGMTQLALDTELTSSQRKYLRNVKLSADGLLGLLNDILDFSKIEAGQLIMEKFNFNLIDTLDNIISMNNFAAEKKGVELHLQYDARALPVFVKGDELRLRQVLVNLIGNAIKFTEEGSVTIKVTAENRENNQVRLHFIVIDTGIGIPTAKQAMIFSSFSQADASTTRQFGGTGLGLCICKQLVEMMGGVIWVENNADQGSIFHFTVLLEHGKKEYIPLTNDNVVTQVRELDILLVDDVDINCEIARYVLEKDNHRIVTAGTGIEALELVASQHFDLILMDVQMPVMDGLTASTVIRVCEDNGDLSHFNVPEALSKKLIQKCKHRYIPIVAMTANAMEGDKEKCLAAGMDTYLAKPFEPAQVRAVIADITCT